MQLGAARPASTGRREDLRLGLGSRRRRRPEPLAPAETISAARAGVTTPGSSSKNDAQVGRAGPRGCGRVLRAGEAADLDLNGHVGAPRPSWSSRAPGSAGGREGRADQDRVGAAVAARALDVGPLVPCRSRRPPRPPPGPAGAARHAAAVSIRKVSRSRLLTPTIPAPASSATSSSVAVCTSTSASSSSPRGYPEQRLEPLARQRPNDEQHRRGARGASLHHLQLVEDEVLPQDRDGDFRGGRAEIARPSRRRTDRR